MCPADIIRRPNLCTGVAYDNFDRFVDTRSGKDTLHDTVGIIFQNVDYSETPDIAVGPRFVCQSEAVDSSTTQTSKKRRRKFDAISHELPAYIKKPRLVEKLLPINQDRSLSPPSFDVFKLMHFAWMLSHKLKCDMFYFVYENINMNINTNFHFRLPDTSMWIGYNSSIQKDKSSVQKVSYLTTINSSPTNVAVVRETMIQAQKIALECGERYLEVTYDLAIAKVALQIQSIEKPLFDNLFIHLGQFHVMLAFFKALGKFIDGSGITNVMVDTELLANGSVNGFITGKHFNRCKRLHPLIALALQILHSEAYLEDKNIQMSDTLRDYLIRFKSGERDNVAIENGEMLDLVRKYEEHETMSLNGEHGKTAQFFMMYVQFVKYYMILNTSIRTADFELLKFILPKIGNLFFTFNQPNYARYLVKYHDNLLNIDNTHPGLKSRLEKGSFGIRRTSKSYSRQPIDLTLEQTINADAANKLTGKWL